MSLWGSTYSRLPHGFFDRAEVLEAGPGAAVFLLKMSDFADTKSTDGRLTKRQWSSLGAAKSCRKYVDCLTNVGLVEVDETDESLTIVGWLDGHRTADEKEAISHKRRSAGRKGGSAKANQPPDDQANAKQVAKQVAKGLLKPEQNRVEQSREKEPATAPKSVKQETPDEPGAVAEDSDSKGQPDRATEIAQTSIDCFGIVDPPPPNPGEVATVRHALKRGWTAQDIIDAALDAGHDPAVHKPRAWWKSKLEKGDPPASSKDPTAIFAKVEERLGATT